MGYQFTPPEPGFPYLTFNFDTDFARMADQAEIMNTTSPVIDSFASRGGKILITHGNSDPVFAPMDTVRYIEDVQARFGSQADSIARLFLVPGRNHCSGGPATEPLRPAGPAGRLRRERQCAGHARRQCRPRVAVAGADPAAVLLS